MYSLSFPEIFKTNRTILLQNKDAAKSNLLLLLDCVKTELFGDPAFGSNVQRFLYEPTNLVIQDLLIDDIYTTIKVYIPQIIVERKNITVEADKTIVLANIVYKYIQDNKTDMFSIKLTEEG